MTATTDAALALLRQLGAADIPHPGGRLLDHLVRTHDQLVAWDQPPDVCLAGLCHAAYGTDGFPTALLGLDERTRLQAAIGEGAERIVHDYGASNRRATYPRLGERPLRLTDRFAGVTRPLDDRATAAFVALTIANELDVLRHADLDPGTAAEIVGLFRTLAAHAPDAGERALAEMPAPG